MRGEKWAEKVKFAFAIVIYSTKRDAEKSALRSSGTKLKQAQTLQFLNEMVASMCDGTDFRHVNYQIS